MLSADQEQGMRVIMDSQHEYIIGIDECGLGAFCGPLVVAGVVFNKGWGHPEVKDSKKFNSSKKSSAHTKRNAVFSNIIYPNAKYYTVQSASAQDIDTIGIEAALFDLGRAAYTACLALFPDSLVVMDGTLEHNIHKDCFKQTIAFPAADALVPAVSAASILAKIVRDEYMIQADRRFPEYGFAVHKGYGTQKHIDSIRRLGLCAEHRKSYRKVVSIARGR